MDIMPINNVLKTKTLVPRGFQSCFSNEGFQLSKNALAHIYNNSKTYITYKRYKQFERDDFYLIQSYGLKMKRRQRSVSSVSAYFTKIYHGDIICLLVKYISTHPFVVNVQRLGLSSSSRKPSFFSQVSNAFQASTLENAHG